MDFSVSKLIDDLVSHGIRVFKGPHVNQVFFIDPRDSASRWIYCKPTNGEAPVVYAVFPDELLPIAKTLRGLKTKFVEEIPNPTIEGKRMLVANATESLKENHASLSQNFNFEIPANQLKAIGIVSEQVLNEAGISDSVAMDKTISQRQIESTIEAVQNGFLNFTTPVRPIDISEFGVSAVNSKGYLEYTYGLFVSAINNSVLIKMVGSIIDNGDIYELAHYDPTEENDIPGIIRYGDLFIHLICIHCQCVAAHKVAKEYPHIYPQSMVYESGLYVRDDLIKNIDPEIYMAGNKPENFNALVSSLRLIREAYIDKLERQ